MTRRLLALAVEAVQSLRTIGVFQAKYFLVAEAKLAGKIIRTDILGSACAEAFSVHAGQTFGA